MDEYQLFELTFENFFGILRPVLRLYQFASSWFQVSFTDLNTGNSKGLICVLGPSYTRNTVLFYPVDPSIDASCTRSSWKRVFVMCARNHKYNSP